MKGIEALRNQVAIQGQHGNWNCNSYMLGMFNGLECALATMEDREPQYKSAPENWLDDLPLPASSGPEQTKCKTCDNLKRIPPSSGSTNFADWIDCPVCAKDRAEPKCVCRWSVLEPRRHICAAFLENKDEHGNDHVHCGRINCGHMRACHTPAPAAKEVKP